MTTTAADLERLSVVCPEPYLQGYIRQGWIIEKRGFLGLRTTYQLHLPAGWTIVNSGGIVSGSILDRDKQFVARYMIHENKVHVLINTPTV